MNRNYVIVVYNRTTDELKAFGNLKKACEAFDWVYNTIVRKGSRFEIDNFLVQKVELIQTKRN